MSTEMHQRLSGHWFTYLALTLALVVLSSCGGTAGEGETAADTLTRRQKDSIVSELPVPGAGAVGRALDAADAARAGSLS